MQGLLDRFRLDDRIAIVTGSGRGIGAATALALAEAGAHVVVTARTKSQIDETADAVRRLGRRALSVRCDVLVSGDRDALVEQTLSEFGRVDILVNNAGGWSPTAALSTSEEDLDACFRFNVTSAFALSRLLAPELARSPDGGAVINISSVAGLFPQPGFIAYGTAKAALAFLTRNLAQDFAPKIRVNAIAVGSVMTDALAGFMTDALERKMLSRTPAGRLGAPEDVAAAALFLASPAAAYVTGEVLGVHGGLSHSQVEMPRADL